MVYSFMGPGTFTKNTVKCYGKVPSWHSVRVLGGITYWFQWRLDGDRSQGYIRKLLSLNAQQVLHRCHAQMLM